MDVKEWVGVTEFASLMGVSKQRVSVVLKEGLITSVDYSGKRPKIHFEKAKKEWAANYRPEKIQNDVLAANLSEENIEVQFENGDLVINADAGYTELQRIQMYYKAKEAQIAYNVSKNKFIPKDAVDKEYYALGQSLRMAVQGIADKTIDHIMAELNVGAEYRGAVHAILYKELTEVMQIVSETNQPKI